MSLDTSQLFKFFFGLILSLLFSAVLAKPTSSVLFHNRQDPPQQYFSQDAPSVAIHEDGSIKEPKILKVFPPPPAEKSRHKRSPYPPGLVMWSVGSYSEPCFCPPGNSKCRCHFSLYFDPDKSTATKPSVTRRRRSKM